MPTRDTRSETTTKNYKGREIQQGTHRHESQHQGETTTKNYKVSIRVTLVKKKWVEVCGETTTKNYKVGEPRRSS